MSAADISTPFGESSIVNIAIDYAKRGWPVFPCNPVNKAPLIGKGFKGASRDPEQIRIWWIRYPNAMIGVPMGEESGVIAIDPDAPKEEGDPDGRRNWALLIAQHGSFFTHSHLTPGGGKHVLFRYDPERPLTNSAGALADMGIDVRANGGYIIVPPSIRADGKRYEYEDSLGIFDFAPIPEWIYQLIEQQPKPKPSISERATEQMRARRTVNGSDRPTETFFTRVNTEALRNLTAWVLSVFPRAEYQPGTGAYRISSEALGRDLEEDLSISPNGAVDWGVWDLGDPRQGKRTPIDLLIECGHSRNSAQAALWLCDQIGIDPASLGWETAAADGIDLSHLFGRAKEQESAKAESAKAKQQDGAGEPKDDPKQDQQQAGSKAEDAKAKEQEGASAPKDDPETQPVDLWAELTTPSLPAGALPELIDNLARNQAQLMGVDPGGMAMAVLTVCAAAIPDRIQVQVKEHDPNWLESARLWTGLVGLPSTKKTPLTSVAVAPLARIDAELYREYAEKFEKYSCLTPKERKGVPRPLHHRVMLMDVTIEHVQEVMRDSPDGILVFHDELAGWFGGMDKYNSGAGASSNRAFWLQAYNGKPYTWGRIIRGSGHIPNLSTCVLGGIQPSVIQRVAHDGVDDGLIQRLCPIVLRPGTLGTDAPSHGSVDAYGDLIPTLHKLRPPMSSMGLLEVPLRFATKAHELRRELERKHLDLTRLEHINPMLASHLGKYDGLFARLCVIFHCIERTSTGQDLGHFIQADTAERAAKFLHGYLLKHALAFYGNVLGLSEHHSRIIAVAGYILAHKLDRVTNRDIQRGVKTLRDLSRRDTEVIFDHLEAFGWVAKVPAPRPADPPHWLVNPSVHTLFSDRADKERRRRAEVKQMLADLVKGENG
jgi:hypothetical protein